MNAGTATIQMSRGNDSKGWNFDLEIESAGFVSRLYRVADTYKVAARDRFCLSSASLNSQEGKKHSISKLLVDGAGKKLTYDEKDLVRNRSDSKELAIPPCTRDIVGALASLRGLNLAPGHSTSMPITDGKKFAQAKIEAQAKESVSVAGKSYQATRFEAYLFDNVLYKRRGRLLIWISDDPEHLPVQFRLVLGFPIGTITVDLIKREN